MKRILSSFVFIFVFIAYVVFRVHTSASSIGNTVTTSPSASSIIITNTTSASKTTTKRQITLAPTVHKKTAPTVTKTKVPVPIMHMRKGPYVDGTYTGALADAYYERIQVRVVIKNGALTKVSFLPFQIYNGTSQAITSYAMPRLRLEALSIQNAKVNNISGATEISNAFKSSLSGALLKAA